MHRSRPCLVQFCALVGALAVCSRTSTALAGREAVAAVADDQLRIAVQGTLVLPDEVADDEGTPVRVTGLSGVAWLGEDRYVAVMDNSDVLLHFRLTLSQAGKPLEARDLRVVKVGAAHDFEDVASCPEPLVRRIAAKRADRGGEDPGACLLLAEENTPAIRAVADSGGELLGVVPLPGVMRDRRPNRGLESLDVDPDDASIWTANEEALAVDGPAASVGAGTTVRLVRIPLPSQDRQPARQFAYAVEQPHPFVRIFAGEPLAGVSALVALGGGRLLVLERSAGPGLPPFLSRIFLVGTANGADVSGVERELAARRDHLLPKRLLWEDSLGCNLEGLCLGPTLADGNRALVGIADNGGIGTPNQIVGFSLVTPPPKPSASILFVASTLVAIAVLLGRLTAAVTSP